jgi:hypothetical protein
MIDNLNANFDGKPTEFCLPASGVDVCHPVILRDQLAKNWADSFHLFFLSF